MARQVFENQMKVYHNATGVTDLAAPTVAEITTDATDITDQITADGVQFNFNNNTASVDMLAEGKILQRPGTRGLSVTLTAVRDDTTDDFWDEFAYGQEGDLIISPFGVPVASDEVYVVRGAAQEPQPQASSANTFQQAQVEFPATDWNFKATVAV